MNADKVLIFEKIKARLDACEGPDPALDRDMAAAFCWPEGEPHPHYTDPDLIETTRDFLLQFINHLMYGNEGSELKIS